MAEKKSFVMYNAWEEAFAMLTDEQAGALIKAVFAYQKGGEVPEDPTLRLAFSFMKAKFDEDKEKYVKTCEARAEAGSKGGKATQANQANATFAKQNQANQANATFAKQNQANQANATFAKQNQANQADSDCEGDSDSEGEYVSEGVSDCGSEREMSNLKVAKEKTSKKKAVQSTYADDPELNAVIHHFIEHRRKIRDPMTDYAIKLFVDKVNELEQTTERRIKLINNAIERGWKTVYPLDDSKEKESGADYLYRVACGG